MKSLKLRNRLTDLMYSILILMCSMVITAGIPSPGYSSGGEVLQDEATQFIRDAAHATDQAWEEFHTAAIEGTLASPFIQVSIEGQLHEARRLLMEARKAERSQDYPSVKHMTQQIETITQNIIQASRERKP